MAASSGRRLHFREVIVCAACQQENPATARFCLACGTALIAQASATTRTGGTQANHDGPPTRETGRFLIGEACNRVGLSLRTVRYYEEMGLLNPAGRTQLVESLRAAPPALRDRTRWPGGCSAGPLFVGFVAMRGAGRRWSLSRRLSRERHNRDGECGATGRQC